MNANDRLNRIIEKIEFARYRVSGHHIVKMIAVSKYTNTHAIQSFLDVGQRAFGESRVQDLKEKHVALSEQPIEWHFIGRLQTNKINALIDIHPFMVHSIDSVSLAKSLDHRLKTKGKVLYGLLQINATDQMHKAGVHPDLARDVYQEISECCDSIRLRGVMAMGVHTKDQHEIIKSFEKTRTVFDSLQDSHAKICSMGMSQDFELAIACGSNMVRLGSVLFE
jgi:PLP dependent protein